jgi:hypothetical protein
MKLSEKIKLMIRSKLYHLIPSIYKFIILTYAI